MRLTKFEQSGFILETNNGFRLAFDIGLMTPLEKLEDLSVNVFVVSHMHGDHLSVDHIKKLSPKTVYLNDECIEEIGDEKKELNISVIKSGDKINIEEVEIDFFDVDHGPNVSIVPKENFGFLIKVDGETIYFAGDMFHVSGMDVTKLDVDVALIPVGTFYTFGPEEALDFVKTFGSIKKIIPIHYEKTPDTLDKFIELAKNDFVVEKY